MNIVSKVEIPKIFDKLPSQLPNRPLGENQSKFLDVFL